MTHINAYVAAVSEAEAKVAEANGDLEAAKRLLHEKKVELGLVDEPAADEAPEEVTEDQKQEPIKKGKKS